MEKINVTLNEMEVKVFNICLNEARNGDNGVEFCFIDVADKANEELGLTKSQTKGYISQLIQKGLIDNIEEGYYFDYEVVAEPETEPEKPEDKPMKQIRIYQLPVENSAKFMNLEFVKKHNIMPKLGDYKVVYEAEVEDNATLDDIYRSFNIVHPRDFKGHSLSMSDIVYLDGKYFYCDSFSWEDVTDMFPKPTLKKGEKYECIADYVMEDKSIAYKAGKTYEMLSDIHLGIDEGGSDNHCMREERDFFCHFKKVETNVHKVTLAEPFIHFAKNGSILYDKTKIGTYEKDDLWKKQGGTRDRSGNLTVPYLYYVTIDAMPSDRGKRIFYSRREIKEWLSGKQITIDFNAA